ncbi:MAG: phosphatase PAP2 family protein [Ruminococcus sp.]|jgi:membrane-associated phospholipid phosphatase
MEFLKFLADLRLPVLDIFFQIITLFAQETLVILIICWIYWCRDKKLAYTLGFTYFISGLLVQGLKITFRIPRPWVLDPDFSPVASAVPAATGYSFPSGHTQSGTALFSTLCFASRKKTIRALCIFMIAAIGFSRLYLGVHTPKDVLVSLILTLLISMAVWKFSPHLAGPSAREGRIALLMAVFSAFLLIYSAVLNGIGTLPAAEAADCFKACGAGMGFAAGYYLERCRIRFTFPESLRCRILRFLPGIIGALILQQGLKPLLGSSLPAGAIRYFIVVFWILAFYPFLFHRKKEGGAVR